MVEDPLRMRKVRNAVPHKTVFRIRFIFYHVHTNGNTCDNDTALKKNNKRLFYEKTRTASVDLFCSYYKLIPNF